MGAGAERAERLDPIVSDTGPIVHLNEAGAMALLQCTGDVHVPEAVDRELSALVPSWETQRPPWVTVDVLDATRAAQAASWQQAGLLDYGEAEAVCLALELRPKWLLTDDAGARLFAESLGLEVHGSLGVVLWAAAVGQLGRQKANSALEGLAKSSLWMSARVLKEAREALVEILAEEDG